MYHISIKLGKERRKRRKEKWAKEKKRKKKEKAQGNEWWSECFTSFRIHNKSRKGGFL